MPDRPRSARDTAAAVRAGRLDPLEVVEQALERAALGDGSPWVHLDPDAARAEAVARRGHGGPLAGVPVAVKDLFDVAGQVTRAGSAVPAGPPAAADAPAVARLREAGAVVLGRTRTHEFAWGITTQHAGLGGTANPHDASRVPGGSSGGSAAAVAAGHVPLGLGTDTGASVRLPAAWCGLVGMKPTHGAVPLDGVVPLAPLFDTGGPLVRDVDDAVLALEVLTGSALDLPEPSGVLGVVAPEGCSRAVQRALEAAAARWPGRTSSAALPLTPEERVLAYVRSQAAQALAWHRGTGRWPEHADAYGPDVRGHLEASQQRVDAWDPQERAAEGEARGPLVLRLVQELDALFQRVDLLLLPVAGCGPSRRDDAGTGHVDGTPVPLRSAVLPWTVPANLAGLPACSVPAGTDEDGLPVGVQVVGPRGADAVVLAAARALAA